MFIGIFLITLRIMAYLTAFILLGYLLCCFRVLREKGQKLLSDLVVTLFIAILVFNSFYFHFSLDSLRETARFMGLFLAGGFVMQLLSRLAAKKRGMPGERSGPLLAGCVIVNAGYIGLAVLQELPVGANAALYGGMTVVLCNIVMGFLLEPFLRRFSGTAGGEKNAFRKVLLSPPILGFLSGMAVYLLGVPLPAVLRSAFQLAGKITAPMAMTVIGCKLFLCKFEDIFGDKKLYLACLARLTLLPMAVFLPASLVIRDSTVLMSLVILLGCPPVSVLPIYAGRNGCDVLWCTRYVFLSTLLSALTLPLVALAAGNILAFSAGRM